MRLARSLSLMVVVGAVSVSPAAALAAGYLDPSFGRGGVVRVGDPGESAPDGLAPRRDGSVAVLGRHNGNPAVLALSSRGAVDRRFGDSGWWLPRNEAAPASGAALIGQPKGRLLVAGTSHYSESGVTQTDLSLAQLTPRGVLDRSFGPGGYYSGYFRQVMADNGSAQIAAVLGAPGGRALVVYGLDLQFVVLAVKADGTPDRAYGFRGRAEMAMPRYTRLLTARRLSDGTLLVVGLREGQSVDVVVGRLTERGRPDRRLGGDGLRLNPVPNGIIVAAATIRSNGRIVLGGGRSLKSTLALAQLLPNGTPDPNFGKEGLAVDDHVHRLDVVIAAPDGRIYTGSRNKRGFGIAAYGPTGKREWSTSPVITRGQETQGGVTTLAFSQGRLFAGGWLHIPGNPAVDDDEGTDNGAVARFLPPKR